MKRINLTFLFIMVAMFLFGQPTYDKTGAFGEYTKDWAMVEKDGLFGFINIDGSEIVKPQYERFINEEILEGIIDKKKEEIKR